MGGWEWLVYLVISTIITYSLMPEQQSQSPEAFEDIEFPQADEGTPQAVIFGDCWSGDWMVLAVGDYRTSEIRKDGGKK
jgi:hypothetical protein